MLQLFTFMLVGFIGNKTGILDETGSVKLNKVILYICQPALIIASVITPGLDISTGDVFRLFAYGTALNLILLLLGLIFVPMMRVSAEERGAYLFMAGFGNVMFMGYPVSAALYGDEVLFPLFICCLPFNILVYSVGAYLIAGKGEKAGLLRKILLNPAFIFIAAALILFFTGVRLPQFLCDAADLLGGMVIPGAMLLIGASLGSASPREMLADRHIYLLCALKLIIAPVVVKLLCGLFITNDMYLNIVVIASAMPAAAVSTMLSIEYGGNVSVAGRGVFGTTLLSLITIPLMVYLLIL